MTKQHREIFEELKESVPGLEWSFESRDESDSALITAPFVVHRFDGTKEKHTAAHLSISKNSDGQWCYSAGFMQVVDQFAADKMAIFWLLSKLRQFAVEEN